MGKSQHNPLTLGQATSPAPRTPNFYNDLEAQELADRDRNYTSGASGS